MLRPVLERRFAQFGVGDVIEALHSATQSAPPGKRTDTTVGGQTRTALATGADERAQVAAIVLRRVRAVVVGHASPRVERLDERKVELMAVGDRIWPRPLAHAVEVVEQHLEGDEQAYEIAVAPATEHGEQRGALWVEALRPKSAQRLLA